MTRLLNGCWGLAVALIVASASAAAQQSETISFESRQKGRPVQITATVYWPAAGGRVPALVLHHGSGGVTEGLKGMAQRYAGMGVAGVVIDSFQGRGVRSTVQDQSAVTREDFNLDALSVLKALGTNPRIDAARIGIAGFSKGGGAALMASQVKERTAAGVPPPLKYAFHVAFYPSCAVQPYRPITTGAPILMLLGGADTYAGTEPCETYGTALRDGGANIVVRVFRGAPHGYDGGQTGSDPRGENNSQCIFQQQASGAWVERRTGVMVAGADGRWMPDAVTKAFAGCRTFGVSWGPDPDARKLAHTELQSYAQRFLLQ